MIRRRFFTATLCLLAAPAARAADIVWTRMTGQMPVESAPLVVDLTGDGAPEILMVNRAGQALLWKPDPAPLGTGQDGAVVELPGRQTGPLGEA